MYKRAVEMYVDGRNLRRIARNLREYIYITRQKSCFTHSGGKELQNATQ
jgi:hypothetical protein